MHISHFIYDNYQTMTQQQMSEALGVSRNVIKGWVGKLSLAGHGHSGRITKRKAWANNPKFIEELTELMIMGIPLREMPYHLEKAGFKANQRLLGLMINKDRIIHHSTVACWKKYVKQQAFNKRG